MTHYLIAHEWLSQLTMVGTWILFTVATLGAIMFGRRLLHLFTSALVAAALAASMPAQFAIKDAQNQRHLQQVEQEEISLKEYRRLRAWMASIPNPPDLTAVMADGRVSRMEYEQLHAQLDDASLQLIKESLAQHTTKGGEH